MELYCSTIKPVESVCHDVAVAILVFQNNATAAMMVFQTNAVGFKRFLCSNKFASMLAMLVYILYEFKSCALNKTERSLMF